MKHEKLDHAIECCRAWEPEVCLIGNVRADELLAMLLDLRRTLVAEDVRRPGPVGIPGQRDPEHPCAQYLPGAPGTGRCEGDGHYLCTSEPGCVERCADEDDEEETSP